MHDFVYALIGGGLIGMATVGYLYVNGRIAGISGLISQALELKTMPQSPAIWFLFGLFITPFFYGMFVDPVIEVNSSPLILAIAGLLVGLGTRLGSGCTSGHGICGVSRLSIRSIVATLTFMFAGFVVVYVVRHMVQGA